MLRNLKWVGLIAMVIFLVNCKEGPDTPSPQEEQEEDITEWVTDPIIPGKPVSHIAWGTPRKVSHEIFSAEYGRMLRMGGDTIMMVYHGGVQNNTWDNIYLRKSYDKGLTWSAPETLMEDTDPDYWGFANPELVGLRSGRILMAFTGRGRPDDNQHDNIQVMHSDDRGQSWSGPRIVAYGRSWEPAMVQHPGGDVLMVYSSEARWWGTDQELEQEILMVSSENEGMSWTVPRTVAYTDGKRDGMPVPLVLKENKGIVFAIESVGSADSPWIVWSSNQDQFRDSDNIVRWLAVPKSLVNFGGGPYLAQLPTGETILSCHDAGGRAIGADWKKNTMYVLIGDAEAKDFSNVSYPFPDLPPDEGAFFNSIYALDANTLIALGGRNFSDGHSEVHWVTGTIVREE